MISVVLPEILRGMAEIDRITRDEELDALFERSRETPVLLFKHSLTCPISRRARGEFEELVQSRAGGDEVGFALIEIQNARPVSDAVAQRTGVKHESPQVLLLDDGQVRWHTSHFQIRKDALDEALDG